MVVPAITSATPSSGPTGGSTLVEIAGRGFGAARVLVGGRSARDARVIDEGHLTCLVPAGDAGVADVLVQNLDAAGAPIPGEEATLAGGFTYLLPPLSAESDLARLVRTLLRELKRQVLPEVSLTVQTDFDAESGDELHLAQIAKLPALVLVGPELAEDRFFSLNQLPEVVEPSGAFVRRRVPYTVDLGFTLVGVSDHTTELLNLAAATELFFHRNNYLEMDRDPANSRAGRVRYEMDFRSDGDLKVTSQPNESNVRSFSGRFVVRGFDLEELAVGPDGVVIERGQTVAEVVVESPRQLTPPAPPPGRSPGP